jgi:membrane-associated phospholipid phosphatase
VNAWVDPSCPCDPANVNSFDRRAIGNSNGFAGTLSDVTLGLALTLPPVLNWFDQGAGRTWVEDFVVYAESLAVSGLLVTVTKFAVQRPNPSVYATNDPGVLSDPNGYLSFYSGHAALAFSALSTAAVTSNLRYQTGILPWAFVLGLGSTIALGRVAAGDHFYTDIIVGALAGAAVGISVPLLHRRDERQWSLSLAPAPGRIEVLWRSALAF